MKKLLKDKKGITLIALVITIIVLLILAGVTIATLTGENGILTQAGNAKNSTEMASEKEYIQLAYAKAQVESKTNHTDILKGEIQQELDLSIGENKTVVTSCGDGFDILVVDKNYYYTIEKDGSLTGPEDVIEIEYAGDITKNKQYNGDTLETAYQISCIEDLVAFTNMSKTNNFANKYIVLTRNLNFASIYSYNDYTTTEFGNLNNDDTDGNILYTEMSTGTGFIPIRNFKGTFNGQGYTLKNIYVNYSSSDGIALFKLSTNAVIENLNLTGNITGNDYVGGICCIGIYSGTVYQVKNCKNYATITGNSYVGGIANMAAGIIENCVNYGTIIGNNKVGGISGANGNINYCRNYGVIKANAEYCGGITGVLNVGYINNSINYGNITGQNNTGGIAGYLANHGIVELSCNKGEVSGNVCVGGISGFCWRASYIRNSFNTGLVSGSSQVGGILGHIEKEWGASNISFNCYSVGTINATDNVGEVIGKATSNALNNWCKYMYYSKTELNKGIGNLADVEEIVEGIEESYLKSDNMIELLNKNSESSEEEVIWVKDTNNINNGYPILTWQINQYK